MVSEEFIQKVQTTGTAEPECKSPPFPLLQRGKILTRPSTPLCKRGEGEIFESNGLQIMWRISGTRLSTITRA